MREIKYKGWNDKQMLQVVRIHLDADGATWWSPDFDQHRLYNAEYKPLRQYTGLKDKNGKEIYEGDIVRVSGIVGLDWIIEYRTNQSAFILCQQDTPFQHTLEMYNTNMRFYEVIGNIYENTELLKEGSK